MVRITGIMCAQPHAYMGPCRRVPIRGGDPLVVQMFGRFRVRGDVARWCSARWVPFEDPYGRMGEGVATYDVVVAELDDVDGDY
jgi:hypothetical protein